MTKSRSSTRTDVRSTDASNLIRVQVAVVPFGRLRRQSIGGQAIDEAGRRLDRVHHPSLRVAGMRVETRKRHPHRVGREALELQLAAVAAVERVRADGAEARDVEEVGAAADLLVRREADADRAVRDLGMGHQVLGGRDDRRDACLVIGAEQRGPGRRDDVVTDLGGEIRVIRDAEDRRRIVGQHDVAAVPGAVDDRLDVLAGDLGRGVDVRDEANRRRGAGDGGWNASPSGSRSRRASRPTARAPSARPPAGAAASAGPACWDTSVDASSARVSIWT